jgi:uncharacterized damage-inducible protein DinB
MERTKWIDRKFSFDFPEGWIYNITERLRGTEARIADITASLGEEELSHKSGNAWSIKEHIGHLCDLEELHEGRIDDFIARKGTLRAADMDNIKTRFSGHNQKDLAQLMENFKAKRGHFISRLEQLDNETQLYKAMHPRLQVWMRPVDMAFFTAEHDDHHLVTIRGIAGSIRSI